MTQNIDAEACLKIVVDYIRGDLNLENASKNLQSFGVDTNSSFKILKDTPRDNILNINNYN